MKCYVIYCTVTSPDNTSILILAGTPSKRVNAGLRLDAGKPIDSIQPLRFSPSMITHVLADKEQLAHALLVSASQK